MIIVKNGSSDLIIHGCETAERDDRDEAKNGARNHHDTVEDPRARVLDHLERASHHTTHST